jgi:hypothetical protein
MFFLFGEASILVIRPTAVQLCPVVELFRS